MPLQVFYVHGDIRHLEMFMVERTGAATVHGDIRHLENQVLIAGKNAAVHGDIRHLEMNGTTWIHGS